MGRPLRFIPVGGCVVEVTNRTIQGRFLLKPSRRLNVLLVGILGRAQRLYGVKLHACVVLSNHFHLLLSVDSAFQLAQFMAYFQGNLAKEAGRLYNWKGPFWHRRYSHVLVSDEEAAQVGRLRYMLENSCKEDLVSSPLAWPGVSSTRALVAGEELKGIWVDRTRERMAGTRLGQESRSRFREKEEVKISPLPCWSHLSSAARQARVGEMVAQVERETAKRHQVERTRPLGAEAVLLQDPRARPDHSNWSPAPMFHCISEEARQALREARSLFCDAFRRAAMKWRRGDRSANFPEGAFLPPTPLRCLAHVPG
jgi:REP element-mobilizing transposase RayT